MALQKLVTLRSTPQDFLGVRLEGRKALIQRWALAVGLLIPAVPVLAQQHQHAGGGPRCNEAMLACARQATPAFGPDGALWLAFAAGGKVMVARSDDLGGHFAPPVAVTPEPAKLDTGPDARPKVVVDKDGRITVAYAVFKDQNYNGRVYLARSTDHGASFSAPQPITADDSSQRFETLALDPAGGVFATWIDKRNAAAARRQGKAYPGAALAFAWLDGSGSAAPTRIARDETCECCRLAVGFAAPSRPVVAFRNIFDGHTRDHAVITFADAATPGPVRRISVDEWKTDVCPHQGPSLAVSPSGAYHIAWYTAGQARKGVFYARSMDEGTAFAAPLPVGNAAARAERPSVLAGDGKVFVAWKEFDGEATAIRLMVSADDGANWAAPTTVASSAGFADHPLLVSDGKRAFLSWLTAAEGYRLIPLGAPQ